MILNTAALACSIAFQPGDAILSVRTSIAPLTCHVVFVDEGIAIDATATGPDAFLLVGEARRMVADQADPPPDPTSPLQLCLRAAKEACQWGVKSLEVGPELCRFECFPPPIAPSAPSTPPPTNPTGPRP